MKYTCLLLLTTFLIGFYGCSKKQSSLTATDTALQPNNNEAATPNLTEKILRIDTFSGKKYHKDYRISEVKDSLFFLYVAYSEKDSVHITCSKVMSDKYYSGRIIDYKLKLAADNKYKFSDRNSVRDDFIRLTLSSDDLILQWTYYVPMKSRNTGGTMPATASIIGRNINTR